MEHLQIEAHDSKEELDELEDDRGFKVGNLSRFQSFSNLSPTNGNLPSLDDQDVQRRELVRLLSTARSAERKGLIEKALTSLEIVSDKKPFP